MNENKKISFKDIFETYVRLGYEYASADLKKMYSLNCRALNCARMMFFN